MTADLLLSDLTSRGVVLTPNGDRLRVAAPVGVLTPNLQKMIAEQKHAVLAVLRQRAAAIFVYRAAARLALESGSEFAVEVPAVNDDNEFRESLKLLGMDSLPIAHRSGPLGP